MNANAHPAFVIGIILRIVGVVIAVLTVAFLVITGIQQGMTMLASPLLAVPYGAVVLVTIGQYLVSNWRDR